MNSRRSPQTTTAAGPLRAGMTAPLAGEPGDGAPMTRQPVAAASRHSPGQNRLLAALPPEEFERLAPHLELVALQLGEMLYEPGEQLKNACFPTTAIVSLHHVLESGASAESAGVGNEGVVGVSLFMGGDTTPSSAVVQTAGHAYCLPARLLRQEFDRDGPMRRLMLRYTQALMTQMAQTAACNRHHAVEQQLCRFLLLTLDRLPSGELIMTQELVASMLGVRREGITEAAGKLQGAGVISYRRGHITVLDRSGLEHRACECYAVVKKEMGRLLSDVRYREGPPGAA
jgi:CRP-like cAMP-binding protein